ncbi:MAG: ATP-binding protein [Alphaproteobacteria bacterium]
MKNTFSQKLFIGRKAELLKLKALYDRKTPCLAVIKGRRRIGKSRLVAEFALQNQPCRFFIFSGLAPQDGVSAQAQLDHFGRQLSNHLQSPPVTFLDWTDALNHLAHHIAEGDIILFDEISWMAAKDPTFVPKLKVWWDTISYQKPHMLLVFCGSISTWITENILNSTAFFGRIALTLTVEPLSITESSQLLAEVGFKGSSLEIYKLLSILGGVPWYLEQINPQAMADANIKRLCFQKDGLLVLEFGRIFHDLFNGNGATYKKILESLKGGMKSLADVREEIQFSHSGTLSQMMEYLIICGFVKMHRQWSIKTENPLKQSLYRICDPYLRFYLKNIEPNRFKIEQGYFDDLALAQVPGFDVHMGLTVENLLLQNRQLLLKSMGIAPSECSFDGPYRQTKTLRTKGCQVDYLVQTRTKNLFLCEFKFKHRELGIEIIEEVQDRMARLAIPKGYAIVPVLFHIGGVSAAVYDKNYFYRIVDIADFLA